jgi:hypothetical protein
MKLTFALLFLLFTAPCLLAQGIPLNPPIPESLGVNIHFTSPQPGEMTELAEAGFRWVRMDLNWSQTEPVKGQYDFSAYDHLLAALEPYHIRAIFILDYSNKYYDHGLSPYDAAGRQAFANWVAAAVERFHGRGVVWEMYNEPNSKFWSPKPNVQDYIKLAMKVGETIEETAPDETYIGPAGATVDLRFLAYCFQAGLLNYWAAVSIHPYRQRIPESVIRPYYAVDWLIRKYAPSGKRVPIVAGEWGYPSIASWFNMSDEGQAKMLAREFLTNIMEGVPITIWYDWHDDGGDPSVPDLHYGVVRFPYHQGADPVFAPKPAYLAAKTLSRFFSGYTFSKRLSVGGAEDYVLLFVRGNEERLAAWTVGGTTHNVTLSRARGRFGVTDFEGGRMRPLRARRGGLTISVSSSPLYIEPRKPGGLSRVATQDKNVR